MGNERIMARMHGKSDGKTVGMFVALCVGVVVVGVCWCVCNKCGFMVVGTVVYKCVAYVESVFVGHCMSASENRHGALSCVRDRGRG